MADYGTDAAMASGAGPSQAPQPVPQATPPPSTQDSGHPFNDDAVDQAFAKTFSQPINNQPTNKSIPDPSDVQRLQSAASNPAGDQRQWSGVNAQGSPSQLAQAGLGRNVNERLQIWSKLVGDSNAMIGPPIGGQNDIWIRGDDDKFHPADTGHTDFMQDVAKKTGAGIDLAVTSLAALGGAAVGTAAAAPEIGAAIGYAAGPGMASAGREFLMSRMYDVKSKAPDELVSGQLKRDIAIGGSLNLFMGGIMSGMGNIAGNAADSIEQGPGVRSAKIAEAQVNAKNFMDSVGARPNNIITDNGVESPMSDAGSRLFSATQLKRRQLNDLIGTANDQIIAASNNKVNTNGLASVVKDFMQKDGYKFDDTGMPIPYQEVPIYLNEVPSGDSAKSFYSTQQTTPVDMSTQVGSVNASRINRPKMGTQSMNDLAEDYKALASGQMDMGNFLQTIRDWQENAKFKPLDERSDATRTGWANLQHMATTLRQSEIQTRLGNDPDMLNAVNNAYHEYSSSKDAIDMIYNAYKNNQNSPELLAKTFIQPGKQELLSQANSLFADNPQIMKDVRSSWLSEKMGNHVGADGVFNANSFIGDLKATGGETLKQLFKPEELGSIYRAGKIMGSVKNSDLMSQAQGQNVVDAVGDVAKNASGFSFSQPWGIVKWFQNKPKLADYAASPDGFQRLAKQQDPASAAMLNGLASILRNKAIQSTATQVIKSNPIYKNINPAPGYLNMPPVQPQPMGATGSDAAAAQVFK
jgi:hypothetical protein